jgi:hypothetical protein
MKGVEQLQVKRLDNILAPSGAWSLLQRLIQESYNILLDINDTFKNVMR